MPRKNTIVYKSFDVEASPDEEGTFEGYASTWSRDLIDDEIKKGAYTETLANDYGGDGAGIPLYWDHNYGSPLNCIGESVSAAEDEKGLKVKFRFALDSAEGEKAYSLLKRGLVHQMSVGFIVQEYCWVKSDGDPYSHRSISKVKLFEVSVVPVACNQEAEVTDVKSGRAISKDNQALIEQAIDCLNQVVGSLGDSGEDDSAESDDDGKKTDEGKSLELAERKEKFAEIAEYLGGKSTD